MQAASSPLIVARIQGGLGNQMFQYAAARGVAERQKGQVKLHLFSNGADQPRDFLLNSFNASVEFASQGELDALTDDREPGLRRWNPFAVRKAAQRRIRVVREKGYAFAPEILQLSGEVYMDGYWQSEKYF